MKHIKSYENNVDEKDFYYGYLPTEYLDFFIEIIKENNIDYSLFLIEGEKYIGLILLIETTKRLKDRISFHKNHSIHFELASSNVIGNIVSKLKNVTNLPLSELKEIIDIFETSKKYNL